MRKVKVYTVGVDVVTYRVTICLELSNPNVEVWLFELNIPHASYPYAGERSQEFWVSCTYLFSS